MFVCSDEFDDDNARASVSVKKANERSEEILALMKPIPFVQYVLKRGELNRFECHLSYDNGKLFLKFSGKDKEGTEDTEVSRVKDIVKGIHPKIFEVPSSVNLSKLDHKRFLSVVTVDGTAWNLEAETSQDALILVNGLLKLLSGCKKVVQVDEDQKNRWLVIENSGVEHKLYQGTAVAGMLTKEGGGILSSWRSRLFILSPNDKLNYYECCPNEKDPLKLMGFIPFACDQVAVTSFTDSQYNRPYCFGIRAKDQKRTYVLQADTESTREWWLSVINALANTNSTQSVSLADDNIVRKLPVQTGTTTNAGFLNKLGGVSQNTWQRRYVVQKQGILKYYAPQLESGVETYTEVGIIPIVGATIQRDVASIPSLKHMTFLSKNYFAVTANGSSSPYVFEATSPHEVEQWIASLDRYSPDKPVGVFLRVGYMLKRGDVASGWKERYFILSGDKIAYYKKFRDRDPQGEINLTTETEVQAQSGSDTEFSVVSDKVNTRKYILQCKDKTSRDQWIQCINTAITNLSKPLDKHLNMTKQTSVSSPAQVSSSASSSSTQSVESS